MKKTILLSAVIITAIFAMNFSINNTGENNNGRNENIAATHTVTICFNPACALPPNTKAHVVDSFGNDYGQCELINGACSKVNNVPDGVRHIHFIQTGSTYCDSPDFTLSSDTTIYINCTCP